MMYVWGLSWTNLYCLLMVEKLLMDKQVAGWTTAYGDFLTFATVRGAGHMVPFAQPARSLVLFQTFLLGKDLPKNPWTCANWVAWDEVKPFLWQDCRCNFIVFHLQAFSIPEIFIRWVSQTSYLYSAKSVLNNTGLSCILRYSMPLHE